MASTRKTAELAAPEQPDTVQLRCEDLGQTRPFTRAHAMALLELQESRGLKGDGAWQPVEAPADSANI
jgi:hypothetical protein